MRTLLSLSIASIALVSSLPSVVAAQQASLVSRPLKPAQFTRNAPPSVRVEGLDPSRPAQTRELAHFFLEVSDPDGDPVSVRPVSIASGYVLQPVEDEPTPFRMDVRRLQLRGPIPLDFVLELDDGTHTVRETIRLESGTFDSATQTGDVTGDGVPDVVTVARAADVSGVVDAGALYVFAGGATPVATPSAVLVVPGATQGDSLGEDYVRLTDVDGDGTLDVLAGVRHADVGGVVDAGEIYVWHGGTSLFGSVAPTATLRRSTPVAADLLGELFDLVDVTGDGALDLVSIVWRADYLGQGDVGLVLVWEDVGSLTGVQNESALLFNPAAAPGDVLGRAEPCDRFADVNQDGVTDILVPSSSVKRGEVYIWLGGASLAGPLAPWSTLKAPAGSFLVGIGLGPTRVADVTGDGIADVVVSAERTNLVSAPSGAILVWKGGLLAGAPAPFATLTVVPNEAETNPNEFDLIDLNGDEVLDVVCPTEWSSTPTAFRAGAVFLWLGGPELAGSRTEHAKLQHPAPSHYDELARTVYYADVTGDGLLDIIAGAHGSDLGGVFSGGAAYVWSGTVLSGKPAPTASLLNPAPSDSDHLDLAAVDDFDGDGTFDVLLGAETGAAGGFAEAGLHYVWRGGPSLVGVAPPDERLASPTPGPFERYRFRSTRDLTGDGNADVLLGSLRASVGGVANAGQFLLFSAQSWGGPGEAAPHARLYDPAAVADDRLGTTVAPPRLVDLDGDGAPELVSGSYYATVAGADSAGAVHVWRTGASLAGDAPADWKLSLPSPTAFDFLGGPLVGPGTFYGDVTGDGRPDILTTGSSADFGGVRNAGVVRFWDGASFAASGSASGVTLHDPAATMNDQLGY